MENYDICSSMIMSDSIGIFDIPPSMSVPSIMVRGESGVVRWVTMTGGRRKERKVGATECNYYSNITAKGGDSESSFSGDDESSPMNIRSSYSLHSHTRSTWLCENIIRLKEEANATLLSQQFQEPDDTKDGCDTSKEHSKGKCIINESSLSSSTHPNPPYNRQSCSLQWTTKYAPSTFIDLLSDENSNLFLLRWMKAWDAHVFRRKRTRGKVPGTQNNENKSNVVSQAAESVNREDDERPRQRIMLIVGPPGAGKTTMAHIVAKHCGYDAVEINASFDRSVLTLERLISSTVQDMQFSSSVTPLSRTAQGVVNTKPQNIMDTVISTGPRENESSNGRTISSSGIPLTLRGALMSNPKALIVDEMDGVLSSVVPLLLRQDIHRPVICVANDLYAPVLRELRNRNGTDVVVMSLPPIDPQRLLARLKIIILKEQEIRQELRLRYEKYMESLSRKNKNNEYHIKRYPPPPLMDIHTPLLADIVHASNGDVRTSLTTLQFLYTSSSNCQNNRGHNKNGSTTNINLMFKEVCRKDTTMSVWASWQHLFQKREKRKYIQLLEHEEGSMNLAEKEEEEIVSSGYTTLQEYDEDNCERRLHRETHRKSSEKLKVYNGATLLTSQKRPQINMGVEGVNEKHLIETWWTGRNRLHSDTSAYGSVDPGFVYLLNHILPHCGDLSLVLEGAYESYPKQRYTDYSFGKTVHCASTFSFLDTLETGAFSSGGSSGGLSMFQLVDQYRFITAASVFLDCSSLSRMEKVPFPTAESSFKSKLRVSEAISKSFTVSGKFFPSRLLSSWGHVTSEVMAEDVAPLLCRCLLPPYHIKFPSLSFQSTRVLTGKDSDNFAAAVERHARYGFTYVPCAVGSGEQAFRPGSNEKHAKYKNNAATGPDSVNTTTTEFYTLDPGIDRFCFQSQYGSKRKTPNGDDSSKAIQKVMVCRSDVRQLMSCEIKLNRVRLSSASNRIGEAAHEMRRQAGSSFASTAMKVDKNDKINNNGTNVSNHEDSMVSSSKHQQETSTGPFNSIGIRVDEHPLKVKVKVKKDFFGRVITPPTKIVLPDTTEHNGINDNQSLALLKSKIDNADMIELNAHNDSRTKTSTKATPTNDQLCPSAVKYVYFHGCTTGIKRTATLEDFLS